MARAKALPKVKIPKLKLAASKPIRLKVSTRIPRLKK
jgi:hypothetical protein